ncbi:MAG: YfhO family protein [Candidatus Kapabacteria bacterium]|nr:YfhO family protein [Candidatus Kapabacteria bacterium]
MKNTNTSKTPSKNISKKANFAEEKMYNIPLWAIVLVFILTTLLFFKANILGNHFFWEDFVEYVYPTQNFAAAESAKGYIPFWNPYSFGGMPFLADLQSGFFYLPNRILTFFVNSEGKIPFVALELLLIFHFFISQLSMYSLMRSLEISKVGSVIGAVSYSFSLVFVCHVIHPMIVEHLAWFPLVFLFYRRAMIKLNFRDSALAGLIFGMSMLSGHPQITLYEAFFLGIFFIWQLISAVKAGEYKGKNIGFGIISGIIPIVIAVGIFCIQYLPSQELAGFSQRSEMSFEKASEGSLEFEQIFSSITPKLFGATEGSESFKVPFYLKSNVTHSIAPYFYYWETAYYIGLAALILGFIALFFLVKTRLIGFLLTMSIIGFFFALGSNGFIYEIFHKLPLFGNFRNPARMMLYFVFGFSVLSGFGFDLIRVKTKNKTFLLILALISGIIGLISILIMTGSLSSLFNTPPNFASIVKGLGSTTFLLLLFIVGILFLINLRILNSTIGGAILICIIFTDLYIAGCDFNSSKQNPKEKYTLSADEIQKFRVNPPNDIFRVNMRMYKPNYISMARNQGLIDRIMLIEGYNPLILQRASLPVESSSISNALFNVKYELTVDSLRRQPAFRERTFTFPRAWMVHKARVVDPKSIKEFLKIGKIDFRYEVILEEQTKSYYQDSSIKYGDEKVEFQEYNSNSMKIAVESKSAGIMVVSEVYYPAWKAYIDDQPTNIFSANYSLRAIEVPQGKHIIEMKYESATFSLGAWITVITLILSLALLFSKRGKK